MAVILFWHNVVFATYVNIFCMPLCWYSYYNGVITYFFYYYFFHFSHFFLLLSSDSFGPEVVQSIMKHLVAVILFLSIYVCDISLFDVTSWLSVNNRYPISLMNILCPNCSFGLVSPFISILWR